MSNSSGKITHTFFIYKTFGLFSVKKLDASGSRYSSFRPPRPYIRQEHRHHAHQRQPGADVENELDARHVRQPAKESRTDAAQAEHQAEEDAGYHADFVRHQVRSIHHDGGESGGYHQPGDDGHRQRAGQIQVGHGQREGRRAQDGEEDDVLAPVAVAQEAADQGAYGEGGQVGEKAILGLLHRQPEFLYQIEGEVAGHTGVEEVFGENHQHQDAQGNAHHPPGQGRNRHAAFPARRFHLAQHQAIPIPHPRQEEGSQQSRQREPPHGVLPERYDYQRRQQRTYRTAAVAAHLEDGLRQALAPARSHLRHPRSFRMKHRRAATYQGHREEYQHEIGGKRQSQQPHQREAHPQRKGIGLRMAVGIQPDERLEDGGGQLENQRDDANLREGEAERILQERIERGDDRLDHVVQQMAGAHREQNGVCRPLRNVGMALDFIPNGVYHIIALFINILRLASSRLRPGISLSTGAGTPKRGRRYG